jgi:hypothetical protein
MKSGTLVAVWKDGGEVFITTTRSEVFDYSGTACVSLHGVSGWYAADCVRPITGRNIHPSAIMALGAAAAEI